MRGARAPANGRAPDPELLWSELSATRKGPVRCAVAWSGGLDSTVLMHLLVALRVRHPRLVLRALHVDHHLQPASAGFGVQCRTLARRWRVPLQVLDVKVPVAPGISVEEAAREARYAALGQALAPAEVLLTAQHADDQVETVLLALMRGAGPAGLAAMPRSAALGRGRLLRPLLELPRSALQDYAARHGLEWIEDPSNAQLRFDRNFLRAEVVPRLRGRWPALVQTVTRSARHCAAAAAVQAARAGADLAAAADGEGLEAAVLRRLPSERLHGVLRAWFARAGLRSPGTRHLEQIEVMLAARIDSHPLLELPQAAVRAEGGRLLLVQHEAAAGAPVPHDWQWRRRPLQMPTGELRVRAEPHGDLALERLPDTVAVHVPASAPDRGRSLRKLLQELEVPLWEREYLPLLYAVQGRKLLAAGDLWLHPDLRAVTDTRRRGRIVWRAKR